MALNHDSNFDTGKLNTENQNGIWDYYKSYQSMNSNYEKDTDPTGLISVLYY
jgi:hypothetical protein